MKDILERGNPYLPRGWQKVLWLLLLMGIGMFGYGILSNQAERTWQAFLINTTFWGGMAQAGVMLSVIWQITDAKWGRPYKRIVECYASYLIIAVGSFMLVGFGAEYLYQWVEHPLASKASYLNLPFFLARNGVGLLIMLVLSYFYIGNAIIPDLMMARKLIPAWGKGTKKYGKYDNKYDDKYDNKYDNKYDDKYDNKYDGKYDDEVAKRERRARYLAPILAICYTLIFSMVAFDYIMSLDQEWFSTLFGVFVLIGNLYSALALLLIIVTILRRNPLLAEYMTITRYNDLAKLTFAIAMLYVYMAFSQYLVIWYSNLAEEAPFLVTRSSAPTPWRPLFWILFGVLFILPFITLISRTICRSPVITATIALILLVGQWWAHYLLIVPSIQDRHPHPQFLFGLTEILITLGFAAIFLLCITIMMRRVPILPISDKHLCKSWHGH